eukprot:8607198-Lingulodinium_polyedra.AAC.1
MAHSPFGPGVVASEGRYFWVWLVSPCRGQPCWTAEPQWSNARLECIAQGTWKRPASTVGTRTGIILRHPSSFAVPAGHWNTYC